MHWRRKWQPTPVFLPGESQGRGSLVGCCLWVRTESDMTEVTYQHGIVGRTWEGIHGPSLSEQNTWYMTLFLFSTVLLSPKIKYSTNFFGFTTLWEYLHWTVMKLRLWVFLHYSVQSLSHVQLFVTPWTAAHQASLSITNSQSPPKPTSIELVMPSNHPVLCRPLLLLPSIFPSIRVFSNESAVRIRWPKYWSFSFNISPSNEHPGLISFRMGWMDLLAVQGTLKSLLQHHSSKASILRCSAFFIVQLLHLYMTTGKTIILIRWTFVDKVMSLLFNMLSRLVITFLPRSKRLSISWLQSPCAVSLEPRKIKSATVSPSICHGGH